MLKEIRLQQKRERKAAKRRGLRKERLGLYARLGVGQGLRRYQIDRLDSQIRRGSRIKEAKLRARSESKRAKDRNRAMSV